MYSAPARGLGQPRPDQSPSQILPGMSPRCAAAEKSPGMMGRRWHQLLLASAEGAVRRPAARSPVQSRLLLTNPATAVLHTTGVSFSQPWRLEVQGRGSSRFGVVRGPTSRFTSGCHFLRPHLAGSEGSLWGLVSGPLPSVRRWPSLSRVLPWPSLCATRVCVPISCSCKHTCHSSSGSPWRPLPNLVPSGTDSTSRRGHIRR